MPVTTGLLVSRQSSVFPKMLDSLVTNYLTFKFGNSLINEQHGFFAGRSTDTNLFLFTDFIYKNLESGKEVDCIYTDMTKAFDLVNIKQLVKKLAQLGVANPLLSWLESYLSNRVQQVIVNGFKSREFRVNSGVPQGSHAGPLLFSIYINDVIKSFKHSSFLLFADDLKLYRCVESAGDCELLQNDLNMLNNWCTKNGLCLNSSKCNVLRFSRRKDSDLFQYYLHGEPLVNVSEFKDLGVTMETSISFNKHLDVSIAKSNKMLGFLKRTTSQFTSIRVLCMLYTSLVRSILEYCCIIWSPLYTSHINRIERVQRNFIKYLCFKVNAQYSNDNYINILKYFGYALLCDRRKYYDICFSFKVLNNLIRSPEILSMFDLHVPNRFTRGPPLLSVQYHRTNYGSNCPLNRIFKNANSYSNDLDFFGGSFGTFKLDLRNVLGF